MGRANPPCPTLVCRFEKFDPFTALFHLDLSFPCNGANDFRIEARAFHLRVAIGESDMFTLFRELKHRAC
jgi:hypothetical protein